MAKGYDSDIEKHYRKVAEEKGLSATSTMEDEIVRKKETEVILDFVADIIRKRASPNRRLTVMDVGCGNGFTLQTLAQRFRDIDIIGVEQSTPLRELAKSRFNDTNRVEVLAGDIRENNFSGNKKADVVICQRVIINLLDPQDQLLALKNIVSATKSAAGSSSYVLFMEAFSNPLANLNRARKEFGLEPIDPAEHNIYLPDDFYAAVAKLRRYESDSFRVPENVLSTHYFVTRVLHAYATKGLPFVRNSEFVKFFSHALAEGVGDYSPLRVNAFEVLES